MGSRDGRTTFMPAVAAAPTFPAEPHNLGPGSLFQLVQFLPSGVTPSYFNQALVSVRRALSTRPRESPTNPAPRGFTMRCRASWIARPAGNLQHSQQHQYPRRLLPITEEHPFCPDRRPREEPAPGSMMGGGLASVIDTNSCSSPRSGDPREPERGSLGFPAFAGSEAEAACKSCQ